MKITLGEILDRQQIQENRLEICCAALRDNPDSDANLRLLSYYLARRRRHQAVAADALTEPSLAQARSAIFDSECIPACVELPDLEPVRACGDTIVRIVLKYARSLCSLYRALFEQEPNEASCSLLRSLIDLEKRDINMLRKLRTSQYF